MADFANAVAEPLITSPTSTERATERAEACADAADDRATDATNVVAEIFQRVAGIAKQAPGRHQRHHRPHQVHRRRRRSCPR